MIRHTEEDERFEEEASRVYDLYYDEVDGPHDFKWYIKKHGSPEFVAYMEKKWEEDDRLRKQGIMAG